MADRISSMRTVLKQSLEDNGIGTTVSLIYRFKEWLTLFVSLYFRFDSRLVTCH